MDKKDDKKIEVVAVGKPDLTQVPEDVLNSYMETLYEEILKIKEDEREI